MMGEVGYAAAVVLAAVFAVAAMGKAARPAATRGSFAALRLPSPNVLAVAVPAAELALAAALVVVPVAGAVGALVMLAAFTAMLARAIGAGLGVPCACFGSARREPVSGVEVVRNAMLAALAVVATGAGPPSWPGFPALVVVTVSVAVGRVALGLLDLRRKGARLWPGVPS